MRHMTNVSAEAFSTISWLSQVPRIAIPVYQRDYRWRPGSCEQLLDDIRSVATDDGAGGTHFIGSMLVRPEASGALTLVDGQQRVTTLFLLMAAVRQIASERNAELVASLTDVLFTTGSTPRLRTHPRLAPTLERLLSDPVADAAGSALEENYTFIRHSIESDWQEVWRGVQRLEHVTIELGSNSNAQQIFESLNSTGTPLSDDELIHNYLHMGRSFDAQMQLEREVWESIETATLDATRDFWRDYLVLTSETQPDLVGEFGIYRAFRRRFPDPSVDFTGAVGKEWVAMAQVYGVLLDPSHEADHEISEQLAFLHAFGRATFPLVMGLYRDYQRGSAGKTDLVEALEQIQSLFLRRALVGLTRDLATVGSLCREYQHSGVPPQGLVRRTPEDVQVRLALSHESLPHAGYVLQRLQRPDVGESLQVEHIHPQTPQANWSSDGERTWGDLSTDEQAELRMLLQTIGNLTLLEASLNQGAGNRPFPQKAANYYHRSRVPETQVLAKRRSWGAEEIKERTRRLTEEFLQVWSRPSEEPMDQADHLVRVVDLERRPRRGIERNQFEYVTYRETVWGDTNDVKALFNRVFKALWASEPERLLQTAGDLIVTEKVQRSQYDHLGGDYYLFMGLASQWLLYETQKIISAFELDDEVRVKPATVDIG